MKKLLKKLEEWHDFEIGLIKLTGWQRDVMFEFMKEKMVEFKKYNKEVKENDGRI